MGREDRLVISLKGSKLFGKILFVFCLILCVLLFSIPSYAVDQHVFVHEVNPFGDVTYSIRANLSKYNVTNQISISYPTPDSGYSYAIHFSDPKSYSYRVDAIIIDSDATYNLFLDPSDYLNYYKIELDLFSILNATTTQNKVTDLTSFAANLTLYGRNLDNESISISAFTNDSTLLADTVISNGNPVSTMTVKLTTYLMSLDMKYLDSLSLHLNYFKDYSDVSTFDLTINAKPLTVTEVTSLEYEAFQQQVKTNQLLEDNLSGNSSNQATIDRNDQNASDFQDGVNNYTDLSDSLNRPADLITDFDDLAGGGYDLGFVQSTLNVLYDVRPISWGLITIAGFATVGFILYGKRG